MLIANSLDFLSLPNAVVIYSITNCFTYLFPSSFVMTLFCVALIVAIEFTLYLAMCLSLQSSYLDLFTFCIIVFTLQTDVC